MPTELQQRHARRIEQYAALVPWFRELLCSVDHDVLEQQQVDITLIWARVGKNIQYLRFHFLVDGLGEGEQPFRVVITGEDVILFAETIDKIFGSQAWNASGMPLCREGVN